MRSIIKSCKELKNETLDQEAVNRIYFALNINHEVLTEHFSEIRTKMAEFMHEANDRIKHDVFIWKVEKVMEKIGAAKENKQLSVFSPPYYSSHYGYKFCMRLYLNGDGTARNTHISIFLVILSGPYDNIVEWPFKYRVSFCLVDQCALNKPEEFPKAQDVIESFRPDPNSNSFKYPATAMNIASGIPRFLPLEKIKENSNENRYVLNDTLFIKVFIDYVGVARSLIKFILNLDPSLPSCVRNQMINNEIENSKKNSS